MICVAVLKGWKFPIQVDSTTGKIKTIDDNENIKQDIRLILETQKFERKVVPEFGTDLRSYMFEIINPGYVSDLRNTIKLALQRWEKNIVDLSVDVNVSLGPVGKVFVDIGYMTSIMPMHEKLEFSLNGATVS